MNLKDIVKIQDVLKKDMKKALNKGKVEKTIQLIDCFADTTQRINNILRDDDVEDAIKTLSQKYIDSSGDIVNGDSNTIVMYDQIGTTACLGVQYLRGLVACGYKIIYIFENYNFNASIVPGLRKEVEKYCSEYYEFNSRNVYHNGNFLGNTIREIIIKANPSKIIVHPQATGALGMVVMHSIKGSRKYRIVPGDHHFYVGYDCFDHFIEFRPFGWSTAIYERHIPANKIYSLSYYPIIDEFVSFQGFPEGTKGKVILGSGGATYKFQGSNDFYINLESILEKSNKAVFVFMGRPSGQLLELSQKDNLKDKIFFLGYRKDFAAVMKNIDILINSYPFSGGLFCQTAARFSKPILAYSPESLRVANAVEDLLGGAKNGERITLSDRNQFLEHAANLIDSEEYRKKWGEFANSIQQTEENFNKQLRDVLNGTYPTLEGINVNYVDRAIRIEQYIKIRDRIKADYLIPLARTFKLEMLKFIFIVPNCILKNKKLVFRHIIASYMRSIKS